jgi:chromosome segregation ATPase
MEANYYMVVIVAILLSTAIAYLLGNRFAKRAVVELELAKQELEKINELLIAGQNAKALMQADVQQAQLQLARTEADKQGVLAANQLLSKDLADVKQSVELFRTETQKAKEQSAAAQSELAGSAAARLKNRFESAAKELSELRSKNTNLHAELSETKSSLDSLEKQNSQLEQRLHTVLAEKQELQQQHTQLTRDSSEAKAQLESQRMQSHDLNFRLEQSQIEHNTLRIS